jgi:hypothetical protein
LSTEMKRINLDTKYVTAHINHNHARGKSWKEFG